MSLIIDNIRQKLIDLGNNETRDSSQRYFRESILIYGVRAADIKKVSSEFFKTISNFPKSAVFDLCEELWLSGYIEESLVACEWSFNFSKEYEPSDFKIFEKWVMQYIDNWASCDTLCNHTVGTFIEKYPEFLSSLKSWADSDNRWVRRAAAVSLILPARKGKFLLEIIEIAEKLLTDHDDMVQKGYGWMLKEAGRLHQDKIFNFVLRNKVAMPRTALRYAIEKMPPEMRAAAMQK